MFKPKFRVKWLLLISVGNALSLGCGHQELPKLPVQPVTGKVVRKNGEPAQRLEVVLLPASSLNAKGDPVRVTARTDDKGSFSLGTYTLGDGVPVGEYKVTVLELNGKAREVAEPLTVKIDAGTAELPTIKLK